MELYGEYIVRFNGSNASDPTEWLKAHKCPTCKNRRQSACVYVVTKKNDGWKCRGYKKEWGIEWLN